MTAMTREAEAEMRKYRIHPGLLGRKLQSVPGVKCPWCNDAQPGSMAVHADGVRFPCGHTRRLPPLHSGPGAPCKRCIAAENLPPEMEAYLLGEDRPTRKGTRRGMSVRPGRRKGKAA